MSVIISVVSAVFWGALLLSVLVFVHEGGHYLAARASSMRVTEFFLGMPCSLKLSHRSKSHGTEIGVTPVLMGGYTRICGMEGSPSDNCHKVLAYVACTGTCTLHEIAEYLGLSEEAVESDLNVLLDWGSIESYENPDDPENFIYATCERDSELRCIYDVGHDFSLEGSTKAGEPHALVPGRSSEGSNELFAISADAKTFFESERSHTYLGKNFWQRFFALVAGPAVNIVLGLLSIALVFSIAGVTVSADKSAISAVVAGSYAEQVGLQANDTITEINGTKTETWSDFSKAINDAAATTETFEMKVLHEGSQEEVTLTLDSATLRADGSLGIYAQTELYHPSFRTSLKLGWRYVVLTAKSIIQLFIPSHTAEVISQSSSVVGISVMASKAARTGANSYIYLLAAVSLSLGFMNLLPIPPLDGGKILLEIIGAIKRKPVSEKVQLNLSYIGLAMFLTLFVFAVRQDIVRFILGG